MTLSDICRALAGGITALTLVFSTVAPYQAPPEPTPIQAATQEVVVATHPPETPIEEAGVIADIVPTPTPEPTQHIAESYAPKPIAASGSKYDWMNAAGIPAAVQGCADTLITRESGWRVKATNPSSGAYGLPQSLPGTKMASAGADWQVNPVTQLRWALGYVQARYGGFCQALDHSNARGWY